MGKHDGKTPPSLREELSQVFKEEHIICGDMLGLHIFVVVDLPRLTEVIFVEDEVCVYIPKGETEKVCRLKIASSNLVFKDGVGVFFGVIDFEEGSELSTFNGASIIINPRKCVRNNDNHIWIEERDGQYIFKDQLFLPPPDDS